MVDVLLAAEAELDALSERDVSDSEPVELARLLDPAALACLIATSVMNASDWPSAFSSERIMSSAC